MTIRTAQETVSEHQKGLLITAIGGLVLTVDIPLIKLGSGEPWSILLIRSGSTLAVTLIVWSFLSLRAGRVIPFLPGKTGVVVAALYGLSAMSFMAAVFQTSTANLVFILAFNPMFAALLAWIFMREVPRRATLAAMVLMVAGVLIIVGDGISSGHLLGDLLALFSALFIASAITITRASGRDMGFAALGAAVLPFLAAVIMVWQTGYRIDVPGWILFNGMVIMPLSFFCLAIGPKYISGPEVAMFYLLETVLAPVWVWLIFAEVPSERSMIGGTILIVTLTVHSLWQLHANRRRRSAIAVRHPV